MNPPDSEYGRKPFVLDDTTTVMLDDEVISLIKPVLAPGEKLLWVGKPVVRSQDHTGMRVWSISFVAVALLALSCGVLTATWKPSSDLLAHAIQVAFVITLIVLAILIGAVLTYFKNRWVKRRAASRRTFALTDDRAILWQREKQSKAVRVITIPAHSIGSVHRKENADGSGDVIFSGNLANLEFCGFLGIVDVRHVEALARATLVNPNHRHNDTHSVPVG